VGQAPKEGFALPFDLASTVGKSLLTQGFRQAPEIYEETAYFWHCFLPSPTRRSRSIVLMAFLVNFVPRDN
jgi:hypothetical protein